MLFFCSKQTEKHTTLAMIRNVEYDEQNRHDKFLWIFLITCTPKLNCIHIYTNPGTQVICNFVKGHFKTYLFGFCKCPDTGLLCVRYIVFISLLLLVLGDWLSLTINYCTYFRLLFHQYRNKCWCELKKKINCTVWWTKTVGHFVGYKFWLRRMAYR